MSKLVKVKATKANKPLKRYPGYSALSFSYIKSKIIGRLSAKPTWAAPSGGPLAVINVFQFLNDSISMLKSSLTIFLDIIFLILLMYLVFFLNTYVNSFFLSKNILHGRLK